MPREHAQSHTETCAPLDPTLRAQDWSRLRIQFHGGRTEAARQHAPDPRESGCCNSIAHDDLRLQFFCTQHEVLH